MAEDREQRTEEATTRKREKMHEEGQVIRSQDVSAAAVIIVSCLVLGQSFELFGRGAAVFAQRCFRLLDVQEPLAAVRAEMLVLAPATAPLLAAMAAAIVVGVAQARVFSLGLLMPKVERLNPLNNLSNLIPGKQSFMEIGKQILKLMAVGYIGYRVIEDALPQFSMLSSEPPLNAAATVIETTAKLVFRVCVAYGISAAVDYWLARRKYLEDAMMSKQEVRDEHKEQEGRPEIKQRMRRKMQEMKRQRATADVSKATVLIVNPTHYAVALRYEPDRDSAPVVLAKGLDQLALQMRSIARKAGVPVVEQKPLARALYADAKIGRGIPLDLYRAVAEVIAYVMQLQARDRGQRIEVTDADGEA